MQIVAIKRKGQLAERYYSEGTAILDVDGILEVTMTQSRHGEKIGSKWYLQRGDKVTVQLVNDKPKGKL